LQLPASPRSSSRPHSRREQRSGAHVAVAVAVPSHLQGTRLLFCALQNALPIALDAEPDSHRRIRDDGTAGGPVRPA
jgi:hypothetical protein